MKTENKASGIRPVWIIIFCIAYFFLSRSYYPVSLFINSHFHRVLECHFFRLTGIPCPTCGGTRAAYYFVTGNWDKSFLFNPGVFFISVYMMLLFALAGFKLIKKENIRINYRFNTCYLVFLGAVFTGYWIYNLIIG